jgi:parvulin-like peptidyl-prolyl isomerase/Tfp pilus assembly protein PilF
MQRFFERHKKAVIWALVVAFALGAALIGVDRGGLFRSRQADQQEGLTVAATVNGTQIPTETLNQSATNLMNQYLAYSQQMGQDTTSLTAGATGALLRLQVEAQALQGLVRQALYDQEAARRRVRILDDQVNERAEKEYTDLLSSYGITEATLLEYLKGQNRTLDQFKGEMRASVATRLRNEALQQVVVGPIVPSDDDLAGFFEKNITTYSEAEQVRASHILVADEGKAQSILDELALGASFPELATKYSQDTGSAEQGGDLGFFSRGRMVPEFEAAAFALQIGETSGIVETDYGYHIITVTDRKAARTPTLAEAKERVRQDYTKQESDQRFAAWYEGLSVTANVKVNRPLANAYFLQLKDLDQGLAEYERLRDEGTTADPYLPYYIGRIYETKLDRAKQEKTTLEKKESPTDEDRAKIETLAPQIADYRQKALTQYLATLENVDTDEAFLNRILALDPDSATAIYLYGKLLLERGDLIGADVRFKEAIAKDPKNVAAYIASGDVAMRNGNLTQAIEQYKAAMALRQEDVSVLTKLVSAALSLGDLDEADRLLSQVQKIDPENAKLKASQGDLAFQRMRAAQTERDALNAARKGHGDLLAAAQTEREALRAKATRTSDEDRRVAELTKTIDDLRAIAIEEDKRLADLTKTIEGLYGIAIGRYEEALARSGSVDVLIALGRAHLAFGELAKAQRQFEDAIRRSPYNPGAYDGLAEALLAQGEKDRAIENYRTAFSRASADPQRQRLGEKLVELVPGDLDLKLKLAKVYAAQYMWSAAIRQYAAVLTARPDSLESYLGIAEAYKWRAEYDTALSYLAKGLTSVTTDAAKVSVHEKVVDVVQAQVGQGKPLAKAGLDALFDLAKLDLASGRSSQAKTRLDRIAKDDPTYRPTEVADLLKQAAGTGTSVTPPTP